MLVTKNVTSGKKCQAIIDLLKTAVIFSIADMRGNHDKA